MENYLLKIALTFSFFVIMAVAIVSRKGILLLVKNEKFALILKFFEDGVVYIFAIIFLTLIGIIFVLAHVIIFLFGVFFLILGEIFEGIFFVTDKIKSCALCLFYFLYWHLFLKYRTGYY